MKKPLMLFALSVLLVACGGNEKPAKDASVDTEEIEGEVEDVMTEDTAQLEDDSSTTEEIDETLEQLTKEQEILNSILKLIEEGQAFDAGAYIPGDIPRGEYAFVTFDGGGRYYAEKEVSGNIIDNENFDSFGYVYVHEVGNIETKGILIRVEDLAAVGVSGAKELYEILNGTGEYKDSGWYKVGLDIEPGEYVIESYGRGYAAVMSGPVGKSDIVNNSNFEGRYAVNLQSGQYLKISRATITN